ncbi:MAG: dynamin family protein, partial [Mailhella sp.]
MKNSSKILEESLQEMRENIDQQCNTWFSKIESNKKSMEFREDFGDSLLIYVYGKVKSGKSSLGNYVAYGKLLPGEEAVPENCSSMHFGVRFSPDDTQGQEKLNALKKKMEIDKKFAVDFFEATASIQYFKKAGLTWVDSPGLHSLTAENGKLAQDYLACADIVLFTSKSRSSCTEQERIELEKIIRSKKPYLLLLTQCDTWEEDEDENGDLIKTLVMKSAEDQRKIIAWSVESLGKDLGHAANQKREMEKNILPISCLYAETNGEEGSGLDSFFDTLLSVMKSDGMKEKKNAPLRATLTHIKAIKEDIKEKKYIEEIRTKLTNCEDDLKRIVCDEKEKCEDLASSVLHELVGPYLNTKDHAAFRKSVQKKTNDLASQRLEHIIQEFNISAKDKLTTFAIACSADTLIELKDKTASSTRHDSSGSNIGSAVGSIAGLGAGILFGPLGYLLGSAAGGILGKVLGSNFDEDVTEEIVIGNNAVEVE